MPSKRFAIPKFLLHESKLRKPLFEDSEPDDPYENWIALSTREEVDDCIQTAERPGCGKPYLWVRFQLYTIDALPSGDPIEVPQVSLLEVAHELGDHGVKIGLKGKGRDGAAVFWDTRGNSFAVVKPGPTQEGDKRVVSDQGVMLMSINGIGEIRWTVFATQGGWDENKEAVKHFGLIWGGQSNDVAS